MFLRTVLAASWALIAAAAPATPATPYGYSPELAAFYSAVSKQISAVKGSPAYKNDAFACDMTKAMANFPSSPTPLPAPNAGTTLKHVVLAFGTQNYSCPTTASVSAAPSAVGAYAQLFNVSCIAANYPDILATLPNLAYKYQLPSVYFPAPGTMGEDSAETPGASYSYQPLNIIYSGLHTFYDLTTPRFNLDVAAPGLSNGLIYSKKVANSTAWANSTQNAYGVIPYLKLDTISGTTGNYAHVYRMQTAGGMNPKTCSETTGIFSEPYAATYWVYG